MANNQSVSVHRVESRSHDGVTLRSGRRIQYESPVVRRHVSPILEHSHESKPFKDEPTAISWQVEHHAC